MTGETDVSRSEPLSSKPDGGSLAHAGNALSTPEPVHPADIHKHTLKDSVQSEKVKFRELAAELPITDSKNEVVLRPTGTPRAYDPNFKGPVEQRHCTDVPCLILFVVFLVYWAYIAYFAFTYGALERVLYPTDSRGQICGKDLAKNRPFLFYFDLTQCMGATVLVTGCLTETICVERCPNTTFSWMELIGRPQDIETSRLICTDDVDKRLIRTLPDLTSAITMQKCASYYFPSGSIGGRCFPGLGTFENGTTFNMFLHEDYKNETRNVTTGLHENGTVTTEAAINGSKWLATAAQAQVFLADCLADIRVTWWMIGLAYMIAAVFSFTWIIAMKWLAGWMVWLAIAAIIGMFSYFIYYCFNMANALKAIAGTDSRLTFTMDVSMFMTKQDFWLAIGSVLSIVLAVICLIILSLRKRIEMAVALLEEGSKAVSAIKSALLFPILPFVLEVVFVAWGTFVGLYLMSSYVLTGVVKNATDSEAMGLQNNDKCDPNAFQTDHPNSSAVCQFVSYEPPSSLRLHEVANLFTMMWATFFVMAAADMTLAGVFASFYWTWDKSQLPHGIIRKSLYRMCRYHMGSVAFGALLVTVIRMIRGFINGLHRKLKKFSGNITGALLKCFSCCLWCLEKFLKFINRNAYILIAIYGKNFIASAKEAYFLLLRNILRVVALDSVASFLLFLGKVVIVGTLGAASYYFFSNSVPGIGPVVPTLNHIFVPVLAVCLGSYCIASEFFQVYEMAVDTIFLCFLEDSEQNDGSTEKPYFMTRKLMMLLEKKPKNPVKKSLSAHDKTQSEIPA